MKMRVYKVTLDASVTFIEAQDMENVMLIWRRWARAEWGDDYTEEDQPDSIEWVGDGPVLRA